MSTILEKIADIENEMARTQKNKATAGHLGMLKAKLAKLRRELITPKSQGGGTGEGFDVAKVRYSQSQILSQDRKFFHSSAYICT